MKILLSSVIALTATQTPPVIRTPNYPVDTQRESDIRRSTEELRSRGSNPIISSQSASPTVISSNNILSLDGQKLQFAIYSKSASDKGILSYIDITKGEFDTNSCKEIASHPSGVPRVSDGKLNGKAILFLCPDFIIKATVSDYSFATKPSVSRSFDSQYSNYSGGFIASAFSTDSNKRVRQDINFARNSAAIDIVASSFNANVGQSAIFEQARLIIANFAKAKLIK